MTGEPPRRVRVTSPRTGAPRGRRLPATSEIDAQTGVGAVYMASLLRSQRRLAAVVLAALVVLVAGLPLLFTLAPALLDVHLGGVPLPWLVLALAVHPVLVGLGWVYVRAAERTERDFVTLVEPTSGEAER